MAEKWVTARRWPLNQQEKQEEGGKIKKTQSGSGALRLESHSNQEECWIRKKLKTKTWIELKGGEEISHIISWCTRKVRHPAKCLFLTETTVTHHDLKSSSLLGCSTQRPWGGWESIEFLYLVLYLNKGSAESSMRRDTNSLASAGARGVSSATSAGWLGLSRGLQSVSPRFSRFQLWKSAALIEMLCEITQRHTSWRNICAIVFVQEFLRMAGGFHVFSQLLVNSI